MSDLEYAVTESVATILLNRQHRRNSFTLDMIAEWVECIREAQLDPQVRVLVVRGAGGTFCAGVDLDEFGAQRGTPYSDKSMLTERVHPVAHALEGFDKPYIALVQGSAVGAGMDMALMADLRLADTTARFSEGYVRVGLLPGDGGCYLLPRLVGRAKALELLWTGEFIDASEAHRLGIVNHIYEVDDFEERSESLIRRLVEGPPLALRMIKRATLQSERLSLRESLDLISSHQAIIQSTEDSREALAAFQERRKPQFHGR